MRTSRESVQLLFLAVERARQLATIDLFLLFLNTEPLLCLDAEPPSVPHPPKSQIVFTTYSNGTQWSVRLTCGTRADTTFPSNRQWVRSFGDAVPSQAIQKDGSLVFTSIHPGVQATKEGNRYQCIAGNANGKVLSSSAVLTYASRR